MGSTHYFTAYVAVNGSYPPLRTRIDPGDDSDAAGAENHDAVVKLMAKVETVGHKDRRAFAPRITIEMAAAPAIRANTRAPSWSGVWMPKWNGCDPSSRPSTGPTPSWNR